MQQSWPVGQSALVLQPVLNRGAGVRSLGAWVCPPARVARNCAVAASTTGAGAAGGVWAMACAIGKRVRRAKRTRTDFFIRFISAVDGTGGRPVRLQRKECLVGRQCGPTGTEAGLRSRSRAGF